MDDMKKKREPDRTPEGKMNQDESERMDDRWNLEKKYERRLNELLSLVNDLKIFKNMGHYQKSAEILDKTREILSKLHGIAEKLTGRAKQKEGVSVQIEVPHWVAESKGTKEVFIGEIKKETDRAYQIEVEGFETIWLPKDLIRSLKKKKEENN